MIAILSDIGTTYNNYAFVNQSGMNNAASISFGVESSANGAQARLQVPVVIA